MIEKAFTTLSFLSIFSKIEFLDKNLKRSVCSNKDLPYNHPLRLGENIYSKS